MIKITQLRIKNFKSFKKADIPLANGFTAIAGANASGKSNILDALMFVFGITSLKMLRASRLADLINHDAKEDYAKVEIDLKHGDQTYEISRIIDKRGVSICRLNAKKKTLGEISSFLSELGVKPTGHNIVVQGDVTNVIQMNAKERRQIIDEVAGLKEFEEKKEESLRKLEQVDTRVKDTNLVLNERINYLGELEKERAQALEFNSLSVELRSTKATIISEESRRNRGEIEQTNQKISNLEEEIQKSEKTKGELFEQEKMLEEKIDSITKQMIEAGSSTFSTVVREIEEKKAEHGVLKEKLEEKRSRIVFSREKIEKLKEEKNSVEKELEQKKQIATELEQKIKEDLDEWKKLKEMIDQKSGALKSKNADNFEAELKETYVQADRAQKSLFEKRISFEKLLKEKDGTEKIISYLLDEQKTLENALSEKNDIAQQIKEMTLSDPKNAIGLKEKEIDEILGHLHSLKSKSEHVAGTAQKLKALDSSCPVCEQKIDPATIKKLLSEREKQVKELGIEVEKKHAQKENALQEKEKLFHKLHLLNELESKIKGFLHIEQKLQEIKGKINDAKQKIKSFSVESVEKEVHALQTALDATLKQKSLLQQKVDEIKQIAAASQLNVLMEQFDRLNAQKAEREKQLALINAKINEQLKTRIDSVEREKNNLVQQIESFEKSLQSEQDRLEKISKDLSAGEAKMQKLTQASMHLQEEKDRISAKLKNIEEKKEEIEEKISKKEKEINELRIEKSKNEIRLSDLTEEFKEFEATELLKNQNVLDLKKRLPEIERLIKKLGAINMKALDRFEELKKEVDSVKQKADKLDEERKAVLELIDNIDLKKMNVFLETFVLVSKKFSDIYYHFFGGEGKLSLSNQQNPTDGGLLIEAKYKEDKLKSIDAMSGGEKSLTALAFIFAIQSVDPAPFYLFDEADAALDKENSIKLAKMIKEIATQSQFISITHNDSIVKEADQIIGVALNEQKSSVIGLRLKGKLEGEKTVA